MILAVSYRAELLEKEMKQQESRVSTVQCMHVHVRGYMYVVVCSCMPKMIIISVPPRPFQHSGPYAFNSHISLMW